MTCLHRIFLAMLEYAAMQERPTRACWVRWGKNGALLSCGDRELEVAG